MRKLFELDKKNYTNNDQMINRIAVRAIIYEKPFLYMVQSKKFQEYKFPGGGQNPGESLIDTLKRETLEESGIKIQDNMTLYGYVIEKRKSFHEKDTVFHMTSYYYLCQLKEQSTYRHLDPYEIEFGYDIHKVHIDDAIKQNEQLILKDISQYSWVTRELQVLKMIKDEL